MARWATYPGSRVLVSWRLARQAGWVGWDWGGQAGSGDRLVKASDLKRRQRTKDKVPMINPCILKKIPPTSKWKYQKSTYPVAVLYHNYSNNNNKNLSPVSIFLYLSDYMAKRVRVKTNLWTQGQEWCRPKCLREEADLSQQIWDWFSLMVEVYTLSAFFFSFSLFIFFYPLGMFILI